MKRYLENFDITKRPLESSNENIATPYPWISSSTGHIWAAKSFRSCKPIIYSKDAWKLDRSFFKFTQF